MTVYLHGTGIIPFGRYRDRTLEDLAVPAAVGALTEAAAAPDGIDAVYCGNVYGGMLPAHRIAARLGLTGRPAYNVEAACSSSAVARSSALSRAAIRRQSRSRSIFASTLAASGASLASMARSSRLRSSPAACAP